MLGVYRRGPDLFPLLIHGQILNYAKTTRDVGVSPHTVQSYYQILEDTLLAERIDPFHESIRKRPEILSL